MDDADEDDYLMALQPRGMSGPNGGAGISTNAALVAAQLAAYQARVAARTAVSVQHQAVLLEAAIRAHASGRPGPRAITGRYRASWTGRVIHSPAGSTATVGTDAPQARRLEYGFVGRDSLGRHYQQPPFPHVAPAFEMVRATFLASLSQAVRP
ncbi:hypothetical protein [Embleya sp. NPDC059237]|uniref:hypothetical protein n=1 Tax=Embleya sp. NPDC059237 TaxID=3346784 RepID=UPI00367CCC72